jgi:hypothetical protein
VHSLNHSAFVDATASSRAERRPLARRSVGGKRPPPMRRGLAALIVRLAVRLDAEEARRAIV